MKYRANHISTLLDVLGKEVTDHHAKVVALWRPFKQRLSNATQIYEAFDLSTLLESCDGFQDLEAHFSKEEIDIVVDQLRLERAPGPDGFNGAFIKSCWNIISEDFYNLVQDFF